MKAVRLAIFSFLPLMRGRNVLVYEDNPTAVVALSHLTPRSPAMMDELPSLFDTNNICIRARYTQSAANVWADILINREINKDEDGSSPPAYSLT
jgi:hypothetical protein